MRKETRAFITKTYNDYKSIIVAYGCLVILYIVFFGFLRNWTEINLDKVFHLGFGLSLSSSLLGSLIVFGILGFIAIVVPTQLSTRKIEDEPYESRIKALMNGSNVKDNEEVLAFLTNHLENYLVISQDMTAKLTVKRYNQQASALEILVETRYSLTNMCKDKDFKQNEITMFVSPDMEVNNEFGYISHLSTSDQVVIQSYMHKLNADGFRRTLNIDVPRDSKKEVNFCYCIWNAIDNDESNEKAWFYTNVERYSQNVKIEITSELGFDLSFSCGKFQTTKKIRSSQTTKNVLLSQGRIPFTTSLEMFPDESFDVFFFKPEGV